VTVHCLTEELDGGDILLQQTVQAEPGDDEIALRCRNVRVGAELVAEAARQIAAGTAKPIRQDPAAARTFPVRTRREDRELRRRLRERGQAAG
jgi:methionyl-tRNA formyltransferase